ncbi:MAG: acyl-CoA dehydrogenase family protein [Actinomycetota bacterium]|nr:acyl-CoA dehydrogenase family protein [Actinomycetota bacterium]
MNGSEIIPFPRNRLDKADLDLASTLQAMVEKEIVDKRLELKEDFERLLAPSLAKIMLDIGLQKMFWPEEHGGEGHNSPSAAYTVAAALEQVGWADTGLAFLAAHSLALQAAMTLEGARNEEACAAFAPRFCSGERPLVVSFILPAFAEEEGTPEWRGKGFQAAAEKTGDAWRVRGSMIRPTCSALDADLFGAWCAVEGEEAAFILIPGDTPGIRRGPELKKTGLAASRNADLVSLEVTVPGAHCIWRGDQGTFRLLSWYYLGVAAAASGALLANYEIIREWGDNRVIKGKDHIFKDNPLTAALMGEVAKETGVVRLLAYELAGMLAEPDAYGGDGSQALYTAALMLAHQACASAEYTINRTMELMASAGYAKEWQLERYWRDVKTLQCHLGAYELAKHDFARWFYRTVTL